MGLHDHGLVTNQTLATAVLRFPLFAGFEGYVNLSPAAEDI